jgi:hypothetical protein
VDATSWLATKGIEGTASGFKKPALSSGKWTEKARYSKDNYLVGNTANETNTLTAYASASVAAGKLEEGTAGPTTMTTTFPTVAIAEKATTIKSVTSTFNYVGAADTNF